MSFLRTEYDNLLGSRSTPLIRLIVVNIVVFIIANIWVNIPGCAPYFYDYFTLPSSPVKLLHRPWTLFTYMFVHVNVGHIFSNMIWFYFLGRIFADFVRGRRLFYTYILGGFAGGILFFIYANLFNDPGILYGASAGVMAVIVAIAVLVPDYLVYVILIGEVRLKYVALVSFLLTSIVDFGFNSGGKVSHIGGAIYGIIFMLQYKKGNDFAEMAANFVGKIGGLFSIFKPGPKIKKTGGSGTRQQKRATVDNQKKIDAILDKISSSGYDALTKEEKDFLFKSSGKGGNA